jgi:hypothetical protein
MVPMHTVIETPAYIASAREAGLTEEERDEIVGFLARHPDAGDLDAGHRRRKKTAFRQPQQRQKRRLPRHHILCG